MGDDSNHAAGDSFARQRDSFVILNGTPSAVLCTGSLVAWMRMMRTSIQSPNI